MKSDVRVHGFLLWAAIGLLMPLGILTIRMSYKQQGRRRKILFYLHLVFQILSVLLVTAGAILSLRSFENSFDNNHQKIGLVLYGAIWVQTAVGFFRPRRGNGRRSSWYFLHWILGTMISLVGIINIYTGLKAYTRRTLTSTSLYTILFTVQVCFMAFFYLFQDKWDFIQKQGVLISGSADDVEAVTPSDPVILQTDSNNQKVLILPAESCAKRNALKNLFD
ncbi:cytochrome [Tripterygium wilfordii]|uniref:Cytochrome n=2 Tax=Tripterygium wilfordii TaxID=458696 RepID=A0A7J7E2H8_TRIWF|nr:cytochrome [Tripterygium wilfordii]